MHAQGLYMFIQMYITTSQRCDLSALVAHAAVPPAAQRQLTAVAVGGSVTVCRCSWVRTRHGANADAHGHGVPKEPVRVPVFTAAMRVAVAVLVPVPVVQLQFKFMAIASAACMQIHWCSRESNSMAICDR